MAKKIIIQCQVTVRAACKAVNIHVSTLYYQAKPNTENEQVANWLLRLTSENKRWEFGLCFLHLRNA